MRVRFVWLSKEIDISKVMKCPAKVEIKEEWLKSARKAIEEIPSTLIPSPWFVSFYSPTPERVVFELSNGKDKRAKGYDFCHVVIDRKASSLG